MTIAEYRRYMATLASWRVKYGNKSPPRPASINLTRVRAGCCKRGCKEKGRTQRHHIGNDFWFACLLPHVFAARYIEFHPDDTAPLCEKHHKYVHKVYKRLMGLVYFELENMIHSQTPEDEFIAWSTFWKQNFRKEFERWRKRKPHRKRRKRTKTR